ncbi:MAG: restriction endonuclease subunit S [Anaerolineaceae bacterium]|nr:restriction endonuclease subunit S [Anaerolineaceae bacterium]
MASSWKKVTLGQVCQKITDGAHNSPASVDNGFPMASVKDLTRFGINTNSARHISVEDYHQLVAQGCKPEVGDVLIAKDGNSALDTVCVFEKDEDVVLLSSVAILRPNRELVSPYFLKHWFSTSTTIRYLKEHFISGAAIPRVVLKDFKRAEILLPSLEEQNDISHILNSLDDRILLNQKQNATLEAMAQAIFKSWFVDFDPVKAKVEGRQPEGMDAATAALFPSRLVESDLGSIPEGWGIGKIDNLFLLQRGFDLPKTQRTDGDYPVIAASGYSETHNEFMAIAPGVTTGRSGVLGNVYFIHENFWPLNTSLFVKEYKLSTPAHAYFVPCLSGFHPLHLHVG